MWFMGVAGTGKSTVGAALALALGLAFVEGDVLSPGEERCSAWRPAFPSLTRDRSPGFTPWAACLQEASTPAPDW